MKIAGIPRNPKNSPNMSDKDMQLFHQIVNELKNSGHTVEILDEQQEISDGYDAIFHMTRTANTLEKLASCESKGVYVTNSANGVKNCSREKFVEIFTKYKIKQPAYTRINITSKALTPPFLPGWLKKSDGWSCNAEDVQFVTSIEEYQKALSALSAKGCSEALFCEHIAGDIIKFYGVQSEDFFRWYYPNPTATKFGLEKINGEPQKYKFNSKELREIAFRAANALNINIFGGDCIISPHGGIYIIDFNDCPSFSAFRDEAAKKISTSIINKK
jgi:hypothetical protein